MVRVKTIASEIEKKLKEKREKIFHIESDKTSNWILVDCFDVVVHIFYAPIRSYYSLEKLWADAPIVAKL